MEEFRLPEGENEEPIAALVKMVKDGKLDPWNIDIVDLTDKFLTELEGRRELNLRVSGLTIFYLSVIVRMKSEVLDEPEPEPEEEYPYDYYVGDEGSGGRALSPVEMLDREIDRRIKKKDVRKRHTNLYELIKQLKLAEKSERRRIRRQHLIDSGEELFVEPDTEDVVGIAHEEDYERLAEQIYEFVANSSEAKDVGVSIDEISAAFHWPRYLVYLPCLFLVQSGRVDLEQEKIFGDIWVVMTGGSSATSS